MYKQINEELKKTSINNMMKNLVTLRTMLHLTQTQLSEIMGVTRQTLVMYETGKRKMTWSTFLSLVLIFDNNQSTKQLLEIMNIYPRELRDYLGSLER